MISPWEVYFVMQLDTLRMSLAIVGVLASAAAIFGLCEATTKAQHATSRIARYTKAGKAGEEYLAEETQDLANCANAARFWKRLLIPGALAALIAVAAPSSGTLAAMILVPKLTSPAVLEPIGAEAKELYQLAKGALRNMAADKPERKP